MKYAIISSVALATCAVGLVAAPIVFAHRVIPGVTIGGYDVGGLHADDVSGVLAIYEEKLRAQEVVLRLQEVEKQYTLAEIGVSIDTEVTTQKLMNAWRSPNTLSSNVLPALHVDAPQARSALHKDFGAVLALPRNATFEITPSYNLALVRSQSGEQINVAQLKADLDQLVAHDFSRPVDIVVVSSEAPIQDEEAEEVRQIAQELLANGFIFHFEDLEYTMKPFTVRRLLSFIEKEDPRDADNAILGIEFDEELLREYLTTTILPQVDQEPVNARFEMAGEGRVSQFALPKRGQHVKIEETIARVGEALSSAESQALLAVEIVEPEIKEANDLTALGITTLLASGESDFVGSPTNRVHNIRVGASKYNGLLIAPQQEFSFNQFLGPVDAANGFLPELVIKQNVTVPEFGGGLCQVSTTAFRAATFSGLEITDRRNHSYAVSYYGTPGFDSTIYPPYTDLRFLNNTPGYILIQTKIVGTRLIFEFWGTDDGRSVQVSGPTPYDRQPDGAVKATLKQRVTRDGEVLVEDTFYSNYKSPDLFPKVLAANNEPTNPTTPSPTATPASSPTPNKEQAGATPVP